MHGNGILSQDQMWSWLTVCFLDTWHWLYLSRVLCGQYEYYEKDRMAVQMSWTKICNGYNTQGLLKHPST